jgi:hypothetical protein
MSMLHGDVGVIETKSCGEIRILLLKIKSKIS